MDLRVLKYYLMVVKEGNISRAAQLLHVTQPTLSRQLMNLEKQLGTKLFIRGKREITLTENGAVFFQRAQEIVELMDRVQNEFSLNDTEVEGNITIGCVETNGSKDLADFISYFHNKYPKVKFELISGDSDMILDRLDKGLVDIGCLVEPVDYGNFDSLYLPLEDRWGLILQKDHPLAQQESISLDELKEIPLSLPKRKVLNDQVLKWFDDPEKLNVLAKHALLSNSIYLVKNGTLGAISLEGAIGYKDVDDIVFRPIEPAKKTRSILVWKKNKLWSNVIATFLEEAEQFFEPSK